MDKSKYSKRRGARLLLSLALTALFGLGSGIAILVWENYPDPITEARADATGSTATGISVADDGTIVLGGASSNVTRIAISRTSDFAAASWSIFDSEKFRSIDQSPEILFVRFKTAQDVVSRTVVYSSQLPVLNEGDIVKTAESPDVYIVKYKGGKQYIRLILSPSVFRSYGHLKWSNLKTIAQEQMNKYSVSSLVQVAGDTNIYVLFLNGDEGESQVLDTSKAYDAESVYEINSVDRDSYRSSGSSLCSGAATQACAVTNGTGFQSRTCSSGAWSAWGSCSAAACNAGYHVASGACSAGADSTRPVVTAFVIPATATSLTVPITTFTATDDAVVTGYALTATSAAPSAASFSAAKPTSYTFTSSGSKTLYAWARDAAGNVSAPQSDAVTITLRSSGGGGGGSSSPSDTTAPVISAFTIPSTAISLTVSVSTFTATDGTGVTGYMLTESSGAPSSGAAGWTASAPASHTFTSAGNKTLYAWAKDAAGNVSTSLNDAVAITLPDVTAPTVTAFTIPATSSSLTVSVSTLTATDAVGVTGYLLTETSSTPAAGAGSWTSDAPTSYTFTSSGSKILYAWAKDAAGNVSTSLSDAVVITLPDVTAPTVTAFTIPATATSLTVSVSTFTATDGVGVTGYILTESSGAPSAGAAGWTGTAPASYTFATEGAKTLYAWAKDAAGNVSTSLNDAVTVTLSDYVSGAMSTSAKTIFLHHSTGGIVWDGGVAGDITTYNTGHSTNYSVTELAFPTGSPYPWNNYPYDYWNIWINQGGGSEPTLETLTQTYDVIVWKHCYPGSSIQADTGSGSVSSSVKSLENYKLQYAALKEKMHEFPDKRFIVWTGAALVESATNSAEATRAREFAQWVTGTWDEAGDNIFIWDFRQLETEGGLYLLPEHAYATDNSHPSYAFGEEVAPLFAQRIIDVIEGNG